MEDNFLTLDTIPVRVNLEDVLVQLGYPQGIHVSSRIREKVQFQMTETLQLLEPRGAYLRLKNVPQSGFEVFPRVGGIVFALATIGSAAEQRARELVNQNQAATGFIVDAIGTIAAERTADYLADSIRQDCGRLGWKVSRRYAPGYCGWKMEAQREIFSHLPDTLGITLADSCLMIPEKSLSFVCLLSSDGDFGAVKIGNCIKCMQKSCPYRLEPYQKKDQET